MATGRSDPAVVASGELAKRDLSTRAISDALDASIQADTTAFLTVKEYAASLRVHPQTVRGWIKDQKLPATRTPGGQWRIRKDARAA